MNLKISICLTSLLCLNLISSCEFGDTNIDPTQNSSPELSALLATAIVQSSYNNMSDNHLLAINWMQQLQAFDFSGASALNSYRTQFDDYWEAGAYGGLLKISDAILSESAKQDQPAYGALAQILMAKELGTLTSMFGEIPFSNAFNANELQPSYDAQEEIYATVQDLLSEAISTLNSNSNVTIGGDLIYNGDLSKWIQVAHALKARYYMHLTLKDTEVYSQAMNEISLAFTDNASQPDFIFSVENEGAHPLAQLGAQRPKIFIIHNQFYQIMNNKVDPRIPFYMEADGAEWIWYVPEQTLFWSRNNAPQPIISYAELKFLEAEIQLKLGNVTQSEQMLSSAIQANMDYLGVDQILASNYISTHAALTGMSEIERLERIIEEKYLALFGQASAEIWVDYRRTGFPQLTPNSSGDHELNPGGGIPKRMMYPESEYERNPANVKTAADNLGGDLFSQTLWAFEQ